MKVLIADKLSPAGVEYLKNQPGLDVVEAVGSTPEQILELVKDVEAIIVRSETQVTREVLEAAPKLKAVGRAGVGVDNIDVEAATERGVVVMNTPSGNTIATAELTFTHLLLCARPVAQASHRMREGGWDRKKFSGSELRGKTLGVLGLGRIGSEVAKRALAFQMKVIAYDPYLTEERAKQLDVQKAKDLDEVFAAADYITVHMPLTEQTQYMINKDSIAKMKDGVRLVNVARGGIIHEDDLAAALESGKVAAAGIDVFEKEPLAEDSPLRGLPGIVTTPHLGASTKEAQESVGVEIAEYISGVLLRGEIRSAINAPSVDAETLEKMRPYITLAERLGAVLQQVTPDEITHLKVTYYGHIIELDLMPVHRAVQRGYLRKISGKDVNDINAPAILTGLGIEVDTTKSNKEREFRSVIAVEATDRDGQTYSIEGTLAGNLKQPRVIRLNRREVEFVPQNVLLIVENKDVPGIVGMLGSVLGKEEVNIANMSLTRNAVGGTAFTVLELDSAPPAACCEAIRGHEAIVAMHVVDFS